MFGSKISTLLSLFALSRLGSAIPAPAPLATSVPESKEVRSLDKRSQAAPHFVLYDDDWTNGGSPPAPSAIPGVNVFILGFWLAATNGPADMVEGWNELTAAQRASIKSEYNAAGVLLLMSVFGSTDTPTSSGLSATGLASSIAASVKSLSFDGVDVDYEDFGAMNGGTAVNWLVSFQQSLRNNLGSSYVITHAPVAPWFTTDTAAYPGGNYLQVHQRVGSTIDWYNVQFYNQNGDYQNCQSLLTSSVAFPQAALFQIIANGVDANKLVIGKPAASSGDANSGYIDPATEAQCVAQAKAQGWNGGLMYWQYPHNPANIISQVWGSGGVSTTHTTTTTVKTTTTSHTTTQPTTTTTTTHTTTTIPSSGSCAGVPAWTTGVAYTAGQQVVYNGQLWQANYWTEGDPPTQGFGDWTLIKNC